jgi:hypothetical protein
MTLPEPNVGRRLLASAASFGLAVLLAVGAAHWYLPPNFKGSSGGSLWLEPDFLCSAGSSGIAIAVGIWSRRAATGGGGIGARSLAARVLIWVGLTLLFLAVWVDYVFLFTLLIAPSHAFACLRLVALWRRWRTEVTWRRKS